MSTLLMESAKQQTVRASAYPPLVEYARPVKMDTSSTKAGAIKLPLHLEALSAKLQALQDYVKLVKPATSRTPHLQAMLLSSPALRVVIQPVQTAI